MQIKSLCKKNIAVVGWDGGLNDEVAVALSGRLGMHFLSLSDLACYHACRQTKADILNEGGRELYDKFYRRAVADAVDFEDSVISAKLSEMRLEWLTQIRQEALVVFLSESGQTAAEFEQLDRQEMLWSRQRYRRGYDLFIKADDLSTTGIIDEIFKAVSTDK